MATQFAKELLKIGQRNALPLCDTCKRYRTAFMAQRQIDHCGHGKPAFSRQSHYMPSQREYLNYLVDNTVPDYFNQLLAAG